MTIFRSLSRSEAAALTRLALPLCLGQIAQVAMAFTDTVVAGRSSPVDMAAVALATSFWIPGIMFGQGLIIAITPLASQSAGAGDASRGRHYLRQGAWLAAGLSAAIVLLFLFCAELILRWKSIDPLLAEKTSSYLRAVTCGVPALMLYFTQRSYLEGLGRTKPAMFISFSCLALNIPFNIILVFGYCGLPAMGAAGCGAATAILSWLMCLVMPFFVSRADPPALRAEHPDAAALKTLLRIGLPSALAVLNETMAYTIITVFISPLGVTSVAAHQIASNMCTFLWIAFFSVSSAGTIRIGTHLGAGQPEKAKTARMTGLAISMCIAAILACATLLARVRLASLYTDSGEVIALASLLIAFNALCIFPDALQTNTLCALRGWNDTRAVFLVTSFAYWIVSIPLGWIFAMTDMIFPRPLGVTGFWAGLFFGLAAAAVLYLLRVCRLEKLNAEEALKKIGR